MVEIDRNTCRESRLMKVQEKGIKENSVPLHWCKKDTYFIVIMESQHLLVFINHFTDNGLSPVHHPTQLSDGLLLCRALKPFLPVNLSPAPPHTTPVSAFERFRNLYHFLTLIRDSLLFTVDDYPPLHHLDIKSLALGLSESSQTALSLIALIITVAVHSSSNSFLFDVVSSLGSHQADLMTLIQQSFTIKKGKKEAIPDWDRSKGLLKGKDYKLYCAELESELKELKEMANKGGVVQSDFTSEVGSINELQGLIKEKEDEITLINGKNNELSSALDELGRLNSELKEEIKKIEKENGDKIELLKEKDAEINSKNQELLMKSSKFAELNSSIAELTTQIKSLTSEKESLESEIMSLKASNSELESSAFNQSNEINQLRHQLKNKDQTVAKSNESLQRLESEISQLKDQNSELMTSLGQKDEEIQRLSRDLSSTESTIESVKSEFQTFKLTAQKDHESVDTAHNQELSGLNNQINELLSRNSDLQAQVEQLLSTLDGLKKSNYLLPKETDQSSIKSSIKIICNYLERNTSSIRALSNDDSLLVWMNNLIKEFEISDGDLECRIEQLNTEIDELTEENKNLVKEVENFKRLVGELNSCLDTCQSKLGVKNDENLQLSGQIDQLKLEIAQKEEEIDQLSDKVNQLSTLVDENKDLNAKIFSLSSQIDKLKGFQRKSAEFEQKCEELTQSLAESKSDYEILEQNFKNFELESKELNQRQVGSLKEEINHLKAKVESDKVKIADVTNQLNDMTVKNQELSKLYEELQRNFNKVSEEKQDLEAQNQDISDQIQELRSNLTLTEEQCENFKSQLEEITSKYSECQKTCQLKTDSLVRLETNYNLVVLEKEKLGSVISERELELDQIKAKISSNSESEKELILEKEQLNSIITELKDEITLINSKNNELSSALDELGLLNSELKEEIKKNEKDNGDKIELLKEKDAEINSKNQELLMKSSKFAELNSSIAELTTQIKSLTSEKESLESEIMSLKASNSELSTENQSNCQSIKNNQDLIAELNTEIQFKSTLIVELESKITQLEETIQSQRSEFKTFSTSFNELYDLFCDLSEKSTNYSSVIKSLSVSLNQSESAFKDLSDSHDELEGQYGKIKEINEEFVAIIDSLKNCVADRSEIIENLEKEVLGLKAEISEMSTNSDQLAVNNNEKNNQLIQKLKQKLMDKQKEIVQLKSRGRDQTSKILALTSKISTLQLELDGLTFSNSKLIDEVKKSRGSLNLEDFNKECKCDVLPANQITNQNECDGCKASLLENLYLEGKLVSLEDQKRQNLIENGNQSTTVNHDDVTCGIMTDNIDLFNDGRIYTLFNMVNSMLVNNAEKSLKLHNDDVLDGVAKGQNISELFTQGQLISMQYDLSNSYIANGDLAFDLLASRSGSMEVKQNDVQAQKYSALYNEGRFEYLKQQNSFYSVCNANNSIQQLRNGQKSSHVKQNHLDSLYDQGRSLGMEWAATNTITSVANHFTNQIDDDADVSSNFDLNYELLELQGKLLSLTNCTNMFSICCGNNSLDEVVSSNISIEEEEINSDMANEELIESLQHSIENLKQKLKSTESLLAKEKSKAKSIEESKRGADYVIEELSNQVEDLKQQQSSNQEKLVALNTKCNQSSKTEGALREEIRRYRQEIEDLEAQVEDLNNAIDNQNQRRKKWLCI
ncbi:hypothetical protein P9112_013301 [Eukaryota sp. TZLM1-RC]